MNLKGNTIFITGGGEVQSLEGDWKPRTIAVVEFPGMEQAQAWYNSPEYTTALEAHELAFERNLILADGYLAEHNELHPEINLPNS